MTLRALQAAREEIATLTAKLEAVTLQAQIWKMEALTHKSTVQECYQACTGSTGEPGDWNGANPVKEMAKNLATMKSYYEQVFADGGNRIAGSEAEAMKYKLATEKNANALREAQKDADAKQAEIDRLMLEYCPDEMTPEQVEEWGRNQVPVSDEEQKETESGAMQLKMTTDEALEFADSWARGMTFHEGSQGWRIVCMLLAEEVRRWRRGAFICTRCGLRKDCEHDSKPDF